MPKTKKLKKVYTPDSSGIGIKPKKTYTFTPLNVENEVKQKKIVKESDVFELPKKKTSY
jgi:hypothetical protein